MIRGEIRYNIISVRITDEELVMLRRVTAKFKTTTTQVVRGALEATVFANGIEEATDHLSELVEAGGVPRSGGMSSLF